jgi:serine/threonine protein phosphatase PrpC
MVRTPGARSARSSTVPAKPVTPSLEGALHIPGEQPKEEEIDVFGLTHVGKARPVNQDHFLICSLQKTVEIHATSLPDTQMLPRHSQRLAFLGVVADGVGGLSGGEEASRAAVAEITSYVSSSLNCYYAFEPSQEAAFMGALQEGVLQAHRRVTGEAEQRSQRSATTLTLVLAVWPRLYVLQVGDSRCYLLRKDKFYRLTRDQTMAERMIEEGLVDREQAESSRLAHILTSAIGGTDVTPVMTAITSRWGDVILACSDGLTKHVSEDAIQQRLSTMTSAEQVCRQLVDDALDAGGSDNITVLVGYARRGASPRDKRA